MRSSAAQTRRSASLFAALGDETRLRLVVRLSGGGALSIASLTEGLPVTRQGITKHLQVMEHAGLVRNHRRGRESLWQLDQRRLTDARKYLDLISKQWDDALARLKRFVEE
jgi:DNA-binding transcriptional ArsR family regulator